MKLVLAYLGTNENKVKQIHDWLVSNISYDETLSLNNIYNIYGALCGKVAVCQGYADAFKYLLETSNIPCITVSGEATNSEGITEKHAWNYVNINEVWYGVDVTWDDPIMIGNGTLSKKEKYMYFLKGSKVFANSHKVEERLADSTIISYPILSENNCDF